ncbi:MAG: GMC family oxidoreductase [Bryobacteraceae bacterium]|nr:GMC family oxidoreductase [Bryobacteraceae bacterium]
MSSNRHYDVIIIGTGAGGGTLAYKLAPSGKRILILERGGYLRREQENWSSRAVFLEERYKSHENWTNAEGNPFHPGIHYYVGGNTKVYGAALLRMRKEDFGELRHYDGISPAWPIAYEDLAPYYTQAERLYHVHGNRGEDPTEPPADGGYAHPALRHEPRIQQLHDDLERIGRRPFHLPVGVMLDEDNLPASKCIRCANCDGFPCPLNAKSDAQVVCVDPALKYPNVEMLTHAYVERLATNLSGRAVEKVIVKRNGEREEYSADVVVSSCGAINSAALLLRSANDRHPGGLANSSDMVGRNYMCHNNSVLLAISFTPNPTKFQKTIAVNDYYFESDDFEFPLGHISMVNKSDADTLKSGAPIPGPDFTFEEMARHALDFWLTSEDLPDPENRVAIGDDGRIQLRYKENNVEGHRRLGAKVKEMLSEIGCKNVLLPCNYYLGKKIPLEKTAHQCGTARFGSDPSTSVLDLNCKTHDLDNLYVVDGGFFVSSSAVNPGLTIMANALRVGDHLLERLH